MSRVVRDALAIAIQADQPVLLWGHPGEGKSSVIAQVGAQLGRRVEVLIGSIREASDFSGLPMRVGDAVAFAPPSWAVECLAHPDTLLFFDELTTSPPAVQAAMLRVVLERNVGELALPDGVAIVAAANPPETSAGGDDLAPPLANRFCHLDWEAELGDWARGMLGGWDDDPVPVVPAVRGSHESRWRALVVAFIRSRPSLLRMLPADAVGQGRAWPSPRSWDAARRVAAAADAAGASTRVRTALVAGLVGAGPSIELLRFAEALDLPDPEAVLADPSSVPVAGRPDLLMAVLGSVAGAIAADCTRERWDAGWEVLAAVCAGGSADLAALAASDLLELRRDGWPPPASVSAFVTVLRDAALI